MDYEDLNDSSASIDSQALLALEFNNQASLRNDDKKPRNVDSVVCNNDYLEVLSKQKKFQVGIENSWHEINFCAPTVTDFPIPLPPPASVFEDVSSPVATDRDSSTLAGELDVLFSPSEIRVDDLGDLLDISAEAGVCGLRNLGNTCFMSTGVQCLMATPALVHCLLEQMSPTKDTLTAHLAALTHKMWSGQYAAIQPTDFKETLGIHYPQFKDFRQHDCQEFLALLLDGLHEQMNTAGIHIKKLEDDFQDLDKKECNTESTSFSKSSSGNKSYQMGMEGSASSYSKSCFDGCNNNNNNNSTIDKSDNVFATTKSEKILNKEVINDISGTNNNISICNSSNSSCNVENVSLLVDAKIKMNSCSDMKSIVLHSEGVLNNSTHRLTGLHDIIKDAKTSNVNVLVTEQEANNEIVFDSEKFPRSEKTRRRETTNFNMFHIYENNTAGNKRGKTTVTHYNCVTDFREGLDMKRLKMHRNSDHGLDTENLLLECDKEKNQRMENERKHRIADNNLLEKNYRMEWERKRREQDEILLNTAGPSSASAEHKIAKENCGIGDGEGSSGASAHNVEQEADKHWKNHLAKHNSIIVDTFQGQFKSTVICSACKYVSVTYEPFMYLSVPLPHATERQICVTFVCAMAGDPVQYLVTVNKRDRVAHIKEQLLQQLCRPVSALVLAEVLDNHIAKILDENYLIRYVDDVNRNLYAFEISNSLTADLTSEDKSNEDLDYSRDDHMCVNMACTICLEEKETNMYHHIGCTCRLCDVCIVRLTQHYGETNFMCPVCRLQLTQDVNLLEVEQKADAKPYVRMLNVPLVFRLDIMGDGNNNMKTVKLFGHPRLLRLPNRIQSQHLHKVVATVIPFSQPYKLLLVDGQGHHCSRCMFNSHCRGCAVDSEGLIVLNTGDTLAAMFTEPVPEVNIIPHSSTLNRYSLQPLSIYDCIKAFSQSEVLDEHNPWYCPMCQQNQCAIKSLSVWRYPDYLIVYLKRFVFHDHVSTKLEDKVMFPLCGLNLAEHGSLYDLYACVCHIGSVSAGHYTAYTQHPRTGEWHYFNDDYVVKQMPQEEDFSNAYILFYKKRGADVVNEDPNNTNLKPSGHTQNS